MRKLRIGCVSAQYMRKICKRLYLFPQCAIYVQDFTCSPMCNICVRFVEDCTYFSNVQYMRKIVLILQCVIYAQDLHKIVLTSFSNAQYMCKICARLYFFPQCAIYVQDLPKIVLLPQYAIYVQDLCKIVLISPMRNICAKFVQDCT